MYCIQCGQSLSELNLLMCPKCGTQVQQSSDGTYVPKVLHSTLRRDFAVTYVLALMTAICWMAQGPGLWFLNPLNLIYFPFFLSVVARVSFILSFIRVSFNWLIVSSFASTCSLLVVFGMQGYLEDNLPTRATLIFSIATLASVFILSKKHKKSLIMLDRKW
jgi:hypothetical protein